METCAVKTETNGRGTGLDTLWAGNVAILSASASTVGSKLPCASSQDSISVQPTPGQKGVS
jgi:hypothetical protein